MPMQLSSRWTGRVFGTSTGNLFAQLQQADAIVTGSVRVNDDRGNLVTYSAQGTVDDNELRLILTPQAAPTGVTVAQTTITARLQANGSLFADRHSQTGEGGTAILHAADPIPASAAPPPGQIEVEQIFYKDAPIGAVRQFESDLKRIMEPAGRDFQPGRLELIS